MGAAVAAYLATLAGAEQASTRRTHGPVLHRLNRELGDGSRVADISAESLAAWFTAQWQDRAPSTWNVSLDAIWSGAGYWLDQNWLTEDPTRLLRRRKPRPDRDRTLSRERVVEELLTDERIPLWERLAAVDLDRTAAGARLSYRQAEALFQRGQRRRDTAPVAALRADS